MKPTYNHDLALLDHIREGIARIAAYTGNDRTTFYESDQVQDAVMRNLQTLSEATQRLGEGLRQTEPNIPWRAIAGFRNVLVHDYLGVDLDAIWSVVERDLPELAEAVERMLCRAKA